MTETMQNLARRFGDARPGLDLVAVEEAAVPVTVLSVDVLAQERQPLPITEEFILRFVAQGVTDPDAIAAMLGLDIVHVIDAAAAQIATDHLRRSASGELRLTTLGEAVATDMASVRPVELALPLAFDRLIWRIAPYSDAQLLEKKAAQDAGLRILPAERNARITAEDVPVADFNAMLPSDDRQILRVRKATTRKHRYLPVQMLVYADTTSGELDLALCIDDRLAVDHSLALSKIGAVERLELRYEPSVERPILDEELEEQRTSPPDLTSSQEPSTSSSLVRSVSVFEHPDLLQEALNKATDRILLISPWIRRAVVTTDFLAALERRLRAGVSVTIAHGYGDDDSGSDEDALRRLRNLAARQPKFTFVRLRNTHAKILIFDSTWVSTSFNWLSFKGDPERTYRMEEGTIVQIPKRVDDEHARYLQLIEEQRMD